MKTRTVSKDHFGKKILVRISFVVKNENPEPLQKITSEKGSWFGIRLSTKLQTRTVSVVEYVGLQNASSTKTAYAHVGMQNFEHENGIIVCILNKFGPRQHNIAHASTNAGTDTYTVSSTMTAHALLGTHNFEHENGILVCMFDRFGPRANTTSHTRARTQARTRTQFRARERHTPGLARTISSTRTA